MGQMYVHRVAYLLTIGPIPDHLSVLHTCDVCHCCNPAHLFIGTQLDNVRDMLAKGRAHFQKHPRIVVQRVTRIRAIPPPPSETNGKGGGFRYHGEDTPNAKLTELDIREIRRAHAAGEGGHRKLAVRFGVPKQHIARIVKRTAWKHVV